VFWGEAGGTGAEPVPTIAVIPIAVLESMPPLRPRGLVLVQNPANVGPERVNLYPGDVALQPERHSGGHPKVLDGFSCFEYGLLRR
jgi:hypothetical protein